jgi:hypothetical protein
MATKHLYDCESVAAQLLYAFGRAEIQTMVYTARELHVSGEHDLLSQLLTLAWLLDSPAHPREGERAAAFLTRDPLRLLAALCADARPHEPPPFDGPSTIPPPPAGGCGRRAPPPTAVAWSRIPSDWTPLQAGALWWAVHDALRRGRYERAYTLSAQLLEGDVSVLCDFLRAQGVETAMIELLETTVFAPLRNRILLHAFAAASMASLNAPAAATVPPPTPLKKPRSGCDVRERIFTISPAALAAWNVRGSAAPPAITPLFVLNPRATRYWRDVVAHYEIRRGEDCLLFRNDADEEDFYTRYFPTDLPDEWAAAVVAVAVAESVRTESDRTESDRTAAEGKRSEEEIVGNVEPPTKNPWRPALLLCWD